ncbi:hypothetical protein Y032_0866g2762 [Ancylostoma ceylanicum]|uniref:Uncharacterized protein n=1 Tax=Ancylostoma ceylanicum TaxID=53326 RepID=A0A016WBM7_9BILA|nr:hypothetical protein Y032_0866g2762 [Ancylostoma ceylanicum]
MWSFPVLRTLLIKRQVNEILNECCYVVSRMYIFRCFFFFELLLFAKFIFAVSMYLLVAKVIKFLKKVIEHAKHEDILSFPNPISVQYSCENVIL